MKYKAIILDVDGTIVTQSSRSGIPSKKVLGALAKAKETIHVSLATGRIPPDVHHLLKMINISGPSILLNGALIIDSKDQSIIYASQLHKTTVLEICSLLQKLSIEFTINEVNNYEMTYTPLYNPGHVVSLYASKLTIQQIEEVKKSLSHIDSLITYQVPDWNSKLWGLHIGLADGSKQNAVLHISEMLNISPDEIIGVGDGYNDFPLLMACGLKVAMGNAVPELKAIADYVAPSVENDGVADVIEKFIL